MCPSDGSRGTKGGSLRAAGRDRKVEGRGVPFGGGGQAGTKKGGACASQISCDRRRVNISIMSAVI